MEVSERSIDAAAAVPAFSGVVTLDIGDERAYARTCGLAHRALAVPHTTATRCAIASGGKAFTALAVMRLVEDGAIALGDRVRPLLGDDLPLISDDVTVEHLLTHTSGIGDYLDEDNGWDEADYVLTSPVHALAETEAFVPEIDGYPQVFSPGERFKYCNGGYIVLALIAERVSGVPYHDLVTREVCDRAALTETASSAPTTCPPTPRWAISSPRGTAPMCCTCPCAATVMAASTRPRRTSTGSGVRSRRDRSSRPKQSRR